MRVGLRAIAFAVALAGPCGGAEARIRSDADKLRAEAEHACYQDAKRFCNADIPDEAKVEACMRRHLAGLSPACRAMFDKGM